MSEQLKSLYDDLSSKEEWPLIPIGDLAEKVAMGPFGANIKVETFVESGVPIISGNHLRKMFLEEPSFNYITEEHAARLKNSLVYPRDIVFTHAGTIGQVSMIPEKSGYKKYILSQRQFYLRCDNNKVLPEYVLLYFHSTIGHHELLSFANQTGVPSLAQPATNLKRIEIPVPKMDEQKKWYSVIKPLMDLYQNNYLENKRLETLRDSLLPKLMSGELDISELRL